jgi:hypothetical protein
MPEETIFCDRCEQEFEIKRWEAHKKECRPLKPADPLKPYDIAGPPFALDGVEGLYCRIEGPFGWWANIPVDQQSWVGNLNEAFQLGGEAVQCVLDAVMQLGVDKWLDGEELKETPANRAGAAREKALKAIEGLAKERDGLLDLVKAFMYMLHPAGQDLEPEGPQIKKEKLFELALLAIKKGMKS